jgi:hypothetical protein
MVENSRPGFWSILVASSIVAWPVVFGIVFLLIFYVRFHLVRYEHHLARRRSRLQHR